jgi:hypothetical protein
MAWESRGVQRYYYRGVKRGGRVTKTYMGTGPLAMMLAEVDTLERMERREQAEAWQQTRKDMEALDAEISAWWDTTNAILDAYLTAAGYYRHDRGAWRKRARRGPAPQTD